MVVNWKSQFQRRRQPLFRAAARVCLMRTSRNAVSLTQVGRLRTAATSCLLTDGRPAPQSYRYMWVGFFVAKNQKLGEVRATLTCDF